MRCEHRHQNGVHIFIIHESSRQATDDFAVMWAEVLQSAAPQLPIRVLVDMRPAGPPPLGYSARKVNETYSLYVKPGQPVRSAYLFNDSLLIRLVSGFLDRMWRNAHRRFFQGDAFDEALAWLQSDDNIRQHHLK